MNKVTTEEVADIIEDLVLNKGSYMSLVNIKNEVNQKLGNGEDITSGDIRLAYDGTNVYFAFGISELLTEAIKIIRSRDNIMPKPCSPLIMFIDGCTIPINMDIAKRQPKDGYKEPHWIPVTWNIK